MAMQAGEITAVNVIMAGDGYWQPAAFVDDPTGEGAELRVHTDPLTVTRGFQEVFPFSAVPSGSILIVPTSSGRGWLARKFSDDMVMVTRGVSRTAAFVQRSPNYLNIYIIGRLQDLPPRPKALASHRFRRLRGARPARSVTRTVNRGPVCAHPY